MKIRTPGAAFRYAIATGSILWLPTEAFSYWGVYPEVWLRPTEYPLLMSAVALLFLAALAMAWQSGRERPGTRAQPA
jgi:hypothetical protein